MEALNELLVGSERLVTEIGDTGGLVKNLRRGISELNQASRALSQPTTATAAGSDDQLKSARLLAKHNFDTLGWLNQVNNLQVEGAYAPAERLEATDIDSYLAHHHDIVILNTIEEAKRGAEEDVQELHRRWASNEWAVSRRQFIESLGHRSQSWSSSALVVRNGAAQPVSSVPPIAPSTPFSTSSLPGLQSATGGAFPGASQAKSSTALVAVVSGPALSPLRRRQAAVVRAVNQEVYRNTDTNSASMTPARELSQAFEMSLGSESDQDGLSRLDLVGYQNLLEMFAEIVGENDAPRPPGFFSTACFTRDEVASVALAEKRRFLTSHALRYLQDQIWRDWSTVIDTAVRHGQLVVPPSSEGESRIQRLRAYVGYLWFNGDITPVRNLVLSPVDSMLSAGGGGGGGGNNQGTPVWAYVYHCLRIGELQGALKELHACIQSGVRSIEQCAYTSLRYLLQIFQSAPLGSTVSSLSPLSSTEADQFLAAMAECARLYDFERQKPEREADPYREMVLNLLSLHDQVGLSEASIPGSTLEDFLWGNLWFVQGEQLVARATSFASSSRDRRVENGEMALYDRILEYGGSEYFDKDMAAPFNYATVLLCCQRFGDAVAYLWQAGRTLPAVHVCFLALHYGLVLPHQPLAHNPRHISSALLLSGGGGGNGGSSSAGVGGIGSEITPASLLQMYFNVPMQQAYPDICVDYFVSPNLKWHYHIQGMDHALQEAHKLKCQGVITALFQSLLTSIGTKQLAQLVGEPKDDIQQPSTGAGTGAGTGTGAEASSFRTGGWLDLYLTESQVANLLSIAGYYLLTVRRESEEALRIFQLAGRHTDVIEELCNRLSTVMLAGSPDRDFWRTTSIGYYERYLKKGGSSAVIRYLEREGRLDILGSFEALLNLIVFVDACVEGRFIDALNIIDGLALLPRLESEVSAAAQKFATLDGYVRRVADDILIYTVECAKTLYLQYQAEGGGSFGRGVLSEREVEKSRLRERVKAIVMFAGIVKNRLNKPTTASRVARIEDILA